MITCQAHDCNSPDFPVRDGETMHYGCQLRAKGISVAASATPNRVSNREQPLRPIQQPSWEAGVAGETRIDGSFMPYLNDHREEMGVHELAGNRGHVEAAVKELKSNPNVFAAERAAAQSS